MSAAAAAPAAAYPRPITTSSSHPSPPSTRLPLRTIPGDYGPPLIGAIRDRLSYFSTPSRDDFLRSKIRLYGSTVFRTSIPPIPFLSPSPRAIALLDAASFPVLFDPSLVDKTDLFTGTSPPSLSLTGGHRVLPYLDPTDPNHSLLKRLLFSLLSSRRSAFIPEFRRTFGGLFDRLESEIARYGKADFCPGNDQSCFDFLARALFGKEMGGDGDGDGPRLITRWTLFLLRNRRLPPAMATSDYDRICGFFRGAAGAAMEEAERMGVPRDVALHNIVFAVCFNGFGGMRVLFPSLVKWVGQAGGRAHGRLAEEVRSAVRTFGRGEVTVRAVEKMELVKSAVWEAMRVEPPVAVQYGRARRDMVVESHDAGFAVRKGEVLFGCQPFATMDARVFRRAEEYVMERFVGEEGRRMLRYVVWSNGPETDAATVGNKQCVGKDFVVLVARLLLVEIFLRYDSFDIEIGPPAAGGGGGVRITSLKRATF